MRDLDSNSGSAGVACVVTLPLLSKKGHVYLMPLGSLGKRHLDRLIHHVADGEDGVEPAAVPLTHGTMVRYSLPPRADSGDRDEAAPFTIDALVARLRVGDALPVALAHATQAFSKQQQQQKQQQQKQQKQQKQPGLKQTKKKKGQSQQQQQQQQQQQSRKGANRNGEPEQQRHKGQRLRSLGDEERIQVEGDDAL